MAMHSESNNVRARRLAARSFSVPFAHTTATAPNSLPREGYNEHEPLHPNQSPPGHHRRQASMSPSLAADDIWLGPADDVEADVLFPQYTPDKDNKLDMAAFDEMVERKHSLDTGTLKLSKTTSKHSRRTYPENEIKLSEDVYRYVFYMPDSKHDQHTYKLQQLLCEEGRNALEETLKTSGWWIDVLCPTDEEMKTLSKTFHIHPLTSEDVLAQEPREKLEMYPNYTFICFRSFEIEVHSGNLRPFNFYIFIFKNGLLTFHFRESELPAKVRTRANQIRDVMMITPDWLNYGLMDAITDEFANPILQVELEAVSIDELSMVLKRWEQADMVRRISRCRRRSTQLTRLLTSKMDVLKSLMKRYEDWASEEGFLEGEEPLTEDDKKSFNDVYLYLGDIQDHVVTMVQNINHYNRLLGRAHTNYLAQVNVELSQTYRMGNKVMNRLTFLATVFLPLTIVCGLFGMNVKVPGKDYKDLDYYFWIVLIMMLYVAVSVFFGRRVGLL